MFEHLNKPAIIAHRGASCYAPENTLAAFEIAVRQQADAIELDVKLSADDQLVVIHDPTLDRTTNGTGKVVEHTLADLKRFDAGSHFDPSFKNERIPTLEEVLQLVGGKIPVNIELTNYTTPFDNLAEKVADLVRRLGMEDEVFFSSFNPFNLLAIRRQLVNTPVGFLTFSRTHKRWLRALVRKFVRFQSLHPHFSDISPQLIDQSHRQTVRVYSYTINDRDVMSRVFQLGIDGIITDDPLLAQEVASSLA